MFSVKPARYLAIGHILPFSIEIDTLFYFKYKN